MKTNTLKSTKRLFIYKEYATAFALLSFGIGNAQVQNNSTIYISNNTEFYVASGVYNFGPSPAKSQTTKALEHGVLSYASGVTWSGASNAHYVDGYARTYGTSQYILPVGDAGIYAPAGVTPTTSAGVEAAYFRAATSGTLGTGVTQKSTLEYWDIKGSNSKFTLTWRLSSDVLNLTNGNLTDLVIIGYNTTTSVWEIIPSTIDTNSLLGGASTLSQGSITSDSITNLAQYSYFTFGSKDPNCSTLIATSGITKTWNGTWSPSAPTLADPVIINSAYSGNLVCNSLVLNADITLADGEVLEIVNQATGTGKLIMSSESTLLQRNSLSTAPNIELTKMTRPMRRNDYVYWGTPISGDFFDLLGLARAKTASAAGAFDLKYYWNAGPGGWLPLTSVSTGKGYIMRVRNQLPFTNLAATDNIDLKFAGTANNGTIPVTVLHNPGSSPNSSSRNNLLANPYPSAININQFLLENEAIDGYVALWTSATPTGNNSNGITNYTQADYVIYNLAGEITTTPIGVSVNGTVASGQGFMVKSINPSGSGTVEFNNCMRIAAPNNNFFRPSNNNVSQVEEEIDRFKLNLTNDSGIFSQILIAYLPNATFGYDRLYDADRNSSSTTQLYSILDSSGRKLSINGRPSFFDTDVVPLGITKSTSENETFTITIDQREGIFRTGDATVYLYDKALQIYHNLFNGSYTFTSNETVANNRFEIVYINAALSNPDFNTVNVFASIKNNTFSAQTSLGMNEIEIYDIAGRKVLSFNAEGQANTMKPFNHAEGVYIAKIKLENGSIATQKLINRK